MTEGGLEMEVIVNNKTLDSGAGVIQLEQAVGAAIRSFYGAMGKYMCVWVCEWQVKEWGLEIRVGMGEAVGNMPV